MFQGSSVVSDLPSGPISEDQPVLRFPEDERSLTDEHQGSFSAYGAVGQQDAVISDNSSPDDESGHAASEKLSRGTKLYLCVLAVVALSGLVALSGTVRSAPGTVSLETDANFPFSTTTQHPLRPSDLWGAVSKPYPTGAWWLNLAIGDGDFPVAPLPYAFKATSRGIGVSYSAMRRTETLKRLTDAYYTDVAVSAAEGVTKHYVIKYDDLTVTVQHDIEGDGRFRTLAARGSPYMTFEFTAGTPHIKCNGRILEVNGEQAIRGNSMHGHEFKLALSNWQTWLVFTSDTVTWNIISDSEAQLDGPFSGILRLAMLPNPLDEESEEVLKEHANAYTRGGKVAFDVAGNEAEMRFEWEKHGFGDLLMMALPHHMDTIDIDHAAQVTMNDTYQTIKGPMTGIVGSTWTMRENLTDIEWTARTTLSEAAKAIDDRLLTLSMEGQIKKALADDVRMLPIAPDIYSFGKECARTARLALIADELGDTASRDAAIGSLNAFLTPWMKNDNEDLLVYDKTWGGVVTKDGLNDQNADFGNAWYNDHTYHYGYVLYAAAVLIKFQPSFYATYKDQVEFLVADVADTGATMPDLFPRARHKDFYAGHSWTSGLFAEANGKSQESVSESINAYYAVYLLGLAIGNDDMRDWGRVLLAMEIRAARKYWQMPDDNGVYDSFFSSRRMVGMVASLEAVQSTWFGDNIEYVHCINMMPFTPITEELLEYDFMEQEWPVLETVFEGSGPGPQWGGYVSLAGAVVLPLSAWANVTVLSTFDSGNSMSNSLYWIATRPQRGAYNASEFSFEVEIQPRCRDNSACVARGLVQAEDCCPTEEGDMLGCCPSYNEENDRRPSACSSHPDCATLGLTQGECCPALSGVRLACCAEPHEEPAETEPVDPATLCSSYEGCSNLEGACCPAPDGTYLSCCGPVRTVGVNSGTASNSSDVRMSADATEDVECSRHAGCGGLSGECCPTPEGVFLECCEHP